VRKVDRPHNQPCRCYREWIWRIRKGSVEGHEFLSSTEHLVFYEGLQVVSVLCKDSSEWTCAVAEVWMTDVGKYEGCSWQAGEHRQAASWWLSKAGAPRLLGWMFVGQKD
jgi:hypothetical protein